MSREEDLFLQTQPQGDEGENSDSIYLELSKAITERKCRIVQKKEKCKLLINRVIKLREELTLAENEQKRLKEEKEDVSRQQALRVKTLEDAQRSYKTLENTLSELNNQVALEKAETKRKKEEFDEAIKDAQETWESYKEKYENFPRVKKLRAIETEVKKVDIAIKQADMDIVDFRMKTKLKRAIAERKFHLSVIRIAETYKTYVSKVKEHEELQKKILEMKTLISDLESGKATVNQLESLQGPTGSNLEKVQNVVCPQPKVLEFSLPGLMVNSPPPPASDSSQEGWLFDWGSILSTGLSGLRKNPAEKSTMILANAEVANLSHSQTIAHSGLRLEHQKKETPSVAKKVGSPMRLTNSLVKSLVGQRRYGLDAARKRTNESEIINEAIQQDVSPSKKMLVTHQDNKTSSGGPQKSNNTKNEIPSQSVMRKELTKENYSDVAGNKNINPKISNTAVKKSYMSVLNRDRIKGAVTSESISQNLRNILSLQGMSVTEKRSSEPRGKDDLQKSVKNVPLNNQKVSLPEQPKNYREIEFSQIVNADQQNQKFDDTTLLEPGSPAPDLIPSVETNSQPLPQGNVSQTCSPIDFNLSGGSDVVSPEVDEKTKMIYQKMLSEGPYLTQQHVGANTTNVQNQGLEIQNQGLEEGTVRSKYFTESHSLSTPPDEPGDYQNVPGQMFSPPFGGGEFGSGQLISPLASPPPANTVGFGATAPTTKSSFSFGFGSPKQTNKTFFDLF